MDWRKILGELLFAVGCCVVMVGFITLFIVAILRVTP